MEKGIKFAPAMKDWFCDFFNTPLKDLKVVFISAEPYTLHGSFEKIENLNKQGVMFYPLERTTSTDGKSQLDTWRLFNTYFMDYLATNKETLVCIFVGFEASQFAELLQKDSHYKIFLPEVSHPFHDTELLNDLLNKNVNSLLEKHDLDTIDW